MNNLRQGRFSGNASSLLEQFNASLPFDQALYAQDILGSQAHCAMLAKQGIITQAECDTIVQGLEQIKSEIESNQFVFDIADEDIHMAIEKRLIAIVGDAGKKLHTARSRNDQIALDFRLYVLEKTRIFESLLKTLSHALMDLARAHTETLIPGMTHLQHAQPISFAYHLLAYVAMFKRDSERFSSSYTRNNVSPLGCAALAGTPYDTDRIFVAKTLGFDSVSVNCLDTVSDRDFALEILFNLSTLMMHISRLSEELILWSSYEFKFITIDDSYATASSIMPQKKNPDVPELLRGKTGRVYGNLMNLLTVMKGLPLAYNKDTQEDKESVFDSVRTCEVSLQILTEVMQTLHVHPENMEKACMQGHLSATDLADYLVRECHVPFREAYFITRQCVDAAEQNGKDLSAMDLATLQKIDSRIQANVLDMLSLRHSMNARNSDGGTAKTQVQKQLAYFDHWLKGDHAKLP
jgi:argininosuccinate lyase